MTNKEDFLKQEMDDYMDLLFPEVSKDLVEKPRKFALEIPNIGEKPQQNSAPTPVIPESPVAPVSGGPMPTSSTADSKNLQNVQNVLNDVKNTVQDIELQEKLKSLEEELTDKFETTIKALQHEVSELKDAKVPKRQEFDSGGVYKDHLYSQCTRMLDKLLIPLIDIVPDYNLLGTQITSIYDDGTIKNAVVAINIIIPVDSFKHEFKCDMVVLNGLIQAPLFITRSRKVISITKQDLIEELSLYSFTRKQPDDSYTPKKNPFSNSGDLLHKIDFQKEYVTSNPAGNAQAIPNSNWRSTDYRRIP